MRKRRVEAVWENVAFPGEDDRSETPRFIVGLAESLKNGDVISRELHFSNGGTSTLLAYIRPARSANDAGAGS